MKDVKVCEGIKFERWEDHHSIEWVKWKNSRYRIYPDTFNKHTVIIEFASLDRLTYLSFNFIGRTNTFRDAISIMKQHAKDNHLKIYRIQKLWERDLFRIRTLAK